MEENATIEQIVAPTLETKNREFFDSLPCNRKYSVTLRSRLKRQGNLETQQEFLDRLGHIKLYTVNTVYDTHTYKDCFGKEYTIDIPKVKDYTEYIPEEPFTDINQFIAVFFNKINTNTVSVLVGNDGQVYSCKNASITPATRRSVGDIYLIAKVYFPEITVEDIYRALLSFSHLGLSICSTIFKMVYTRYGPTRHYDGIDEWGITICIDKSKSNGTWFGVVDSADPANDFKIYI